MMKHTKLYVSMSLAVFLLGCHLAFPLPVQAADTPDIQRKGQITTRKPDDRVTVELKNEQATYTVTSRSGIGGATITPPHGWPEKVVLRLNLRGLESLRIVTHTVDLRASVLSHSGHRRLLHRVEDGKEQRIDEDSPYFTSIRTLDATGKPTPGLPEAGGCFEVTLPAALLQGRPLSLRLEWIDFYRN